MSEKSNTRLGKPLSQKARPNNRAQGFPLVRLGLPNGLVELAADPRLVSAEELSKERHVLVFAERGHRLDEFLAWLESERKPAEWVEMDLAENIIISKGSSGRLPKALQGDGPMPNSESMFQALREYPYLSVQDSGLDGVFLVFRNFSPLEKGVAYATSLRRIVENSKNLPINFLSLARSYFPFSDDPKCSGYGAICHRYRLANFSKHSLVSQKDYENLALDEPGDDEILDRILEHTGGQPLLVKHLGQFLQSMNKTGKYSLDEVEDAMRKLRSSPPSACNDWIEHLERILKNSTESKTLWYQMKSYAKGETLAPFRFPPSVDELELHIGGWVGLNAEKHWGITSSFHAYLASQVLTGR